MTTLSPEAQAWKRIFAMLYLLKDDFADRVFESKVAMSKTLPHLLQTAKRFHEINVKNHLAICTIINGIHLQAKSKASGIISEEMSSSRLKDLHEFMDVILDIENIGEIGVLLKQSMQPAKPEV